jgi:putative addiction module antidote
MTHLKLRQIGNSLGVVLPQDVVASLGAAQGDMLTVVRTENGIELTPYEPEFEADVAAAKTVMKRYRNALRELAK